MCFHAVARRLLHRLWIALLLRAPLAHIPAERQIAMHRIVGRRLVRHHIRARSSVLHAFDKFGKDFGCVADHGDRFGRACLCPALDHCQSFVQRMGLFIAIAGANAEIGAGLVTLDGQAAGARHHGSQRLRTAHATQPSGQDPLAFQIAIIVLATSLGECLIRSLHDALRADIDP